MNKEDTRATLITAGRKAILESGFNHAGLQAILSSAGVPKGSFYYYFQSKEDFGLAVLEDFATENRATRIRLLTDTTLSPLERLRAYFKHQINRYEANDFRDYGCLMGNMGEELAAQNEAFRVRLEQYFAVWRTDIADCLRAAQKTGELSSTLDVDTAADFCLSSWQGAILRMKVARSAAPLEAFLTTLFDSVLRRP